MFVVVLELLVVMSPPMARVQTPPPSWFGLGFGGALTNALDWVRNAVLAVLMAETSELTALPEANGSNGDSTPATPVPVQSAIAAGDAPSAATTTTLANPVRPRRVPAKNFIAVSNRKRIGARTRNNWKQRYCRCVA